MGAYDTTQVITTDRVSVVALKTPQTTHDAADALGELLGQKRFALPALYEAMDGSPSSARRAIESAIKLIDPNAPKPLFYFEDDLHPAETALREAADTLEGELRRRIENVYEKHAYDENRGMRDDMTRSEVIAFAHAVRDIDQRAYNLFVAKLVERDPSLAEALKPAE